MQCALRTMLYTEDVHCKLHSTGVPTLKIFQSQLMPATTSPASTSFKNHLILRTVAPLGLLGQLSEDHPVEDHHGQPEVEGESELGEESCSALLVLVGLFTEVESGGVDHNIMEAVSEGSEGEIV